MQFFLERGEHRIDIAFESWSITEGANSIPSTGKVLLYKIAFEGTEFGGAV